MKFVGESKTELRLLRLRPFGEVFNGEMSLMTVLSRYVAFHATREVRWA